MTHPAPTSTTVRELYATAFQCAAPGCGQPLYLPSSNSGRPVRNSQVCHIAARSPEGPRWDPVMSASENAAYDNLVLLCAQHHTEVDDPTRVEHFSASVLRRWKLEQVELSTLRGQRWLLDDAQVEELRAASFALSVTAEVWQVGGTGGSAPGAGGGGGGAVGPGAVGGRGGDGGDVSSSDERVVLDGGDATAPGAGGGGGGWMVPGARPWPPGQGPVGTVGAAHVPGLDGLDGGPSAFGSPGDPFYVCADGGAGALAGSGVRSTTDHVIASSFQLIRSGEVVGGTAFVLGGGWSRAPLLNVPDVLPVPVLLVLEAGGAPAGEYTVDLRVVAPDHEETRVLAFPLVVETPGDVVRVPLVFTTTVRVTAFGLWSLVVCCGQRQLAQQQFVVERIGSEATSR